MLSAIVDRVFGKKKRAQRIAPREPLVVNCSGRHGDFTAPVVDLSCTGLCIGTTRTLAKGEEVGLRLMLQGHHVKARAVRVWQRVRGTGGASGYHCGLKIIAIAADDYDLLNRYVDGRELMAPNKLVEDLQEQALRPADLDAQVRRRMLDLLVEKHVLAPFDGHEPLVRYYGSANTRRGRGEHMISIVSKIDTGSHGIMQYRTTFRVRQVSPAPAAPFVTIANVQTLGHDAGVASVAKAE